jgi:hypothetical protein
VLQVHGTDRELPALQKLAGIPAESRLNVSFSAPCHCESNVLSLLKVLKDGEQIARLRIAARSKHPKQTLGGLLGGAAERFEADGRMHAISQHGLAGLDIPSEKAIRRLAEQRLSETAVLAGAFAYGLFEILR